MESKFLYHTACSACGSSDANGVFDDGHQFCFSCKAHTHAQKEQAIQPVKQSKQVSSTIEVQYLPLKKRKLTEETCRKWGYGVSKNSAGQMIHVACYRDSEGSVVGQKTRDADKKFFWIGKPQARSLFGRHLWRDAGKMIVITEGEIDAMSVSQIQDHKWPVVSVASGASGAANCIRENLEWLESFDKVILMFDQDEPGREAAKECAEILSPGKAFIAKLPLKDANEMLVAGRGPEIINAIWGSSEYRPDGVLAGEELWERVSAPDTSDPIPYPWPGLNAKLRGLRRGEIVLFCAGSGIGKSEFVRQASYHFVHGHPGSKEVVGYIALEESIERTALGFMGIAMNKRIHESPDEVPIEERRRAFESSIGSKGRWYLYDHFGSQAYERLLDKIRYMIKGLGCSIIVLDHISIVVSGEESGDEGERKQIDMLMTKLVSIAKETGARMMLVSHIRRTKESHEEGGRVRLNDLRGSGSIGQLSYDVIAIERNQQSPDKANISTLRVLKARTTGRVGVACKVEYDETTGKLREIDDKDDEMTKQESGTYEI